MGYIVGIDEVGRGSLAGPVVVAAVAAPRELRIRKNELGKLKDSKKLTAKQREKWCEYFNDHPHIQYSVARVYPPTIDRINISRAANLAALRAYRKLCVRCPSFTKVPACAPRAGRSAGKQVSPASPRRSPSLAKAKPRAGRGRASVNCRIYLDGSLYLGNGDARVEARTVIRGDEKINAIKAASIIAKVHRDRLMERLAGGYPEYGFEFHKGYGTRKHQKAIREYGPSEVHRLTFVEGYHTM